MSIYFEFSKADNSEKEHVILIYVMHFTKVLTGLINTPNINIDLLTYKKSLKKRSKKKEKEKRKDWKIDRQTIQWPKVTGQIKIYKTLYRKWNIEQQEPY